MFLIGRSEDWSIGRLIDYLVCPVDFILFLIGRSVNWVIGRLNQIDRLADEKEWNQFRNLDLLKIKKLLKSPILLDLRNPYDPAVLKFLGFIYDRIRRK